MKKVLSSSLNLCFTFFRWDSVSNKTNNITKKNIKKNTFTSLSPPEHAWFSKGLPPSVSHLRLSLHSLDLDPSSLHSDQSVHCQSGEQLPTANPSTKHSFVSSGVT